MLARQNCIYMKLLCVNIEKILYTEDLKLIKGNLTALKMAYEVLGISIKYCNSIYSSGIINILVKIGNKNEIVSIPFFPDQRKLRNCGFICQFFW